MDKQKLLVGEVLGEPLPTTIYWDAFLRFGTFSSILILVALVLVLVINEVGKRGAPDEIRIFLWLLVALLLGGGLVFAYFAWQQQVSQYDSREHTYFQLQMVAMSMTVQTNNVDARGKGNTVIFGAQQNTTDPTPDANMGQVVMVADRIARLALESWNLNGGRRPKIKPFSAKAIGEEMGVGGETWTQAIALVEGAGIVQHAAEGQWQPLITNPNRIEDMLLRYMNRQGWAHFGQNGKDYWHKVAPTLPANV